MKPLTAIVVAAASLLIGVALVIGACGGEVTVGYDDAGDYHLGDGGVFTVGSACIGWDGSHNTTYNPTCDFSNDQCNAWLQPPGWNWSYTCLEPVNMNDGGFLYDDAGNQIIQCDSYQFSYTPPCSPNDDASTAFCSAWQSQFVTHGKALSACTAPGFAPSGHACGPGASCPDGQLARVEDDGAVDCVYPCAP